MFSDGDDFLSSDYHWFCFIPRFINQMLDTASNQDKVMIFNEILPASQQLMRSPCGHHVILKLFKCGSEEQIESLVYSMKGNVGALARHRNGKEVLKTYLKNAHPVHTQFVVDELIEEVRYIYVTLAEGLSELLSISASQEIKLANRAGPVKQ